MNQSDDLFLDVVLLVDVCTTIRHSSKHLASKASLPVLKFPKLVLLFQNLRLCFVPLVATVERSSVAADAIPLRVIGVLVVQEVDARVGEALGVSQLFQQDPSQVLKPGYRSIKKTVAGLEELQ